MTDTYTIIEKINKLLIEGNLKISKKLKKDIIYCITLYDIPEENLEPIIEKILDNRFTNKQGRTFNPRKKKINELIKEYLNENNYTDDLLYTTNEYIDNNINEQIYNGYDKNTYSKPKTKSLKIIYKN